ncbi:MAG: carbohydrate-binding domain-containing protein [Oscillospiraceae bacterium]|nr:carbohydrate-binding domain-containing protein [Oscillospiraceae bacterium]
MKKCLSVVLVLLLVLGLLAGCGANNTGEDNSKNDDSNSNNSSTATSGDDANTNTDPVDVDFSKTDGDMFTDRDSRTEYDASKAITIELNGTTATASSNSVKVSGSTVTITEEATYVISGTLSDGMIVVNAPETAKLQLVFNGINITKSTSAALYIMEADKVFVTLADGTQNTLANGGTFTAIDDNNIDGAVYSKQDLTFNGTGSLSVSSPAGHGIVCKDDLVFTGGTYTVNAASHGLDANDSVRIADANITIDAGKDAIHCENSEDAAKGFIYISSGMIKAEAEGDGIAASAYMQIADGTIDLLVGGGSENGSKAHSDNFGGFMGGGPGGMGGRPGQPGSNKSQDTTTEEASTSMKGLKAANSMLIGGGNITINSADDAIHSDVSLTINGGIFTIASGDDAIHAEDTLTVTAGKIDISESYEGLEALHIDVQGGNIKLVASDDGLNAAGGTDQSGTTGGRDGMFGGGPGGMGGGRPGGFGGMSSGNGSIVISGGSLYINSSGDGLDANGTLEISGGYTVVVGPTQGDTATLDYDTSGVITGGTFIGTGASGMAQTFSDSEQGVVAVSVGNQTAGTQILLKDKNGNTVLEHTPELSFAVVILSSPELVKGETYTITVGTQSADFEAS